VGELLLPKVSFLTTAARDLRTQLVEWHEMVARHPSTQLSLALPKTSFADAHGVRQYGVRGDLS
jgi:hypothetical protein